MYKFTFHQNLPSPDGECSPGAWISSAGYACAKSQKYIWDGSNRTPIVIFQYTISGIGVLRVGNENYRVPKHSAMLLITPSEHCYYLPAFSDNWTFRYLTLNGPEAFRLMKAFQKKYGMVHSFSEHSQIPGMLESILRSIQSGELDSFWRCGELAARFFMILGSELESGRYNLTIVERVYACLRSNPQIDMATLAKSIGYSKQYFERLFRRKTGMTPFEYLLNRRLEMAEGLLLYTSMRIKEVAQESGFQDPAYFCRRFRIKYGMSPSEKRFHNNIVRDAKKRLSNE